MTIKYMKRCSTSLTIREMQIKITKRYYHTIIRMAKIKKKIVTTSNIVENSNKLDHSYIVVGNV